MMSGSATGPPARLSSPPSAVARPLCSALLCAALRLPWLLVSSDVAHITLDARSTSDDLRLLASRARQHPPQLKDPTREAELATASASVRCAPLRVARRALQT